MKNARVQKVEEEKLAASAKQRSEEERFWVREGEERLATFDQDTAICHEHAWD